MSTHSPSDGTSSTSSDNNPVPTPAVAAPPAEPMPNSSHNDPESSAAPTPTPPLDSPEPPQKAAPAALAAASSVPMPDPTLSGVLGKLETLSPAEQANLFACEEVIRTGWATLIQVGLALAEIKKDELYRLEYGCFEDYCRGKWQYKLTYVYRLMPAAQLFNHLLTSCQKTKPEHASQVRPLVGLSPVDRVMHSCWRPDCPEFSVDSSRQRRKLMVSI